MSLPPPPLLPLPPLSWRDRLRAAGRGFAFAAAVALSAVEFLWSLRAHAPLAGRAETLSRACRRTLRAMGVCVVATGKPPAGAALIATNHLSYLDVLVLASLAPAVFVSRADVAGWPVFGWFARHAGTRFLDRARRSDVARVAAEFAPAVEAGVPVVLFLEGTTTDGAGVGPFHASLLAPATEAGWAVAPAALRYEVPSPHAASHTVCWWGDMEFAPHLARMLALPAITARVAWGEPQPAGEDRKALAVRLQAQVAALHAGLPHGRSAAGGAAREIAPALME